MRGSEADLAAILERRLMAALDPSRRAGENTLRTRTGKSAPTAVTMATSRSREVRKSAAQPASRRTPAELQRSLLAALAGGVELGLGDLVAAAGIDGRDRHRAYMMLRALRASGAVALDGTKRNAKYRLASSTGASSVRSRTGASSPAPAATPLKKSAPPEPEPDSHDALDLPILRAASRAGDVIVVGGLTEPAALKDARASTGIRLTWVWLSPEGAAEAVERLAARVRAREVAALVVLDALVTGPMVLPLAAAATEVGLAVAFAGLGEAEELRRALIDLDMHLAGDQFPAR
ncbi:MAG: hypothetical protein ACHREM_11100 [Polyangiales bacterium]